MDEHGRPSFVQVCHNNDPSCDFGPDTDACEFRVVACLNNSDPQLPSCPASGVGGPEGVGVFLGGTARDAQNHTAVVGALGNLRDPKSGATGFTPPLDATQVGMCTAPFSIRVPLRRSSGRQLAGRGKIVITTRAPLSGRLDVDRLNLVCRPELRPST